MSSTTRKGGCGCGGASKSHTHSHGGNGGGCGGKCGGNCGCGCKDRGPREVIGDCNCNGPERCGVPCLERPVYSAGQLLTADSLRLGQQYFEERFALRRYVDGVGVVCGMHVRCDPEEKGWIVIEPGYAIDCCGNDIVLCEPVRFNACAAIASCPKPEELCDPITGEVIKPQEAAPAAPAPAAPAAPVDESPIFLGQSLPGQAYTTSEIRGTVTDATTGAPLVGATVTADGTQLSAVTDANGVYAIRGQGPGVPAGGYKMLARFAGYRVGLREVIVERAKITVADYPLPKLAAPAPQPAPLPPPPPSDFHTYMLRIEGAWEGKSPVPVVTSRNGCDTRAQCKPSKEVGSIRVCIEPYEEIAVSERLRERTRRFNDVGSILHDRLVRALEVSRSAEATEKDPNPRGRVIVDALLSLLQENPPRTSCNLYDLLCDVRRLLKGQTPVCYGFPPEVLEDNERALVGLMGQLLDDYREEYLSFGCDDCCEHTGVRVAHIITQDRLPSCTGSGCAIAAIDTHSPAREVLHPRSGWWSADVVSLYDAYFRGAREAAVLLSDRGVRFDIRNANTSQTPPTLNGLVRDWILAHGGEGELARLGLYQTSILYVPAGVPVTLWLVGGRVVAITPDTATRPNLQDYIRENRTSYLRYSVAPPIVTIEGGLYERLPSRDITDIGGIKPDIAIDAALQPAALDPAPFKELIDQVGPKTEAALYRMGKTTLKDIVDTPDVELAKVIRPEQIAYVKKQAREQLRGKHDLKREELVKYAAAAKQRFAKIERMPA